MGAEKSMNLEAGGVQCVTPEQINKLLERVTYSTHIIPGTTSVMAAAIAPGGHVLCVVEKAYQSGAAFNPALAIEMAICKAKGEARAKLWEMEEYRLSQTLYESRQSVAVTALELARAVLARDVPCRVTVCKGEPRAGHREPCPCGLSGCAAAAVARAART